VCPVSMLEPPKFLSTISNHNLRGPFEWERVGILGKRTLALNKAVQDTKLFFPKIDQFVYTATRELAVCRSSLVIRYF
jgi:hypothetical protein